MKIVSIIPARMSSSRLPGKPMKKIQGIPMIGHCYLRAKMSHKVDYTYVATCDEEIYSYIKSIGGDVVMTSDKHERATDRCAEAIKIIEKEKIINADYVLMLQGDEPFITPGMIDASIDKVMNSPNIRVTNMYAKLSSQVAFQDPNEVKVVLDKDERAVYFSREPIPSNAKFSREYPKYKQVCTMVFRRDTLFKFNSLQQTDLEIIESVDMNRLISNNIPIHMVYSEAPSISVDTLSDLEAAEIEMTKDELFKKGYI